MTQAYPISQVLGFPEGTPVSVTATVGKVFALAQKDTGGVDGTGFRRQDFVLEDGPSTIKVGWFDPSIQLSSGLTVTVTGKVDEFNGQKKLNAAGGPDGVLVAGASPMLPHEEAALASSYASPPPPGVPVTPPQPVMAQPSLPSPMAAPTPAPAPQAVPAPQAAPQAEANMTMAECLEVLEHVQRSMGLKGFQDEKAIQAFATSVLIGMQRGEIQRLSLPF